MAIARKVVTLAERAGDNLFRVYPFVTVAHSTDALSTPAALDGRICLSTVLRETRLRVDVRSRTLALVPMVELVTVTDSALVRSYAAALLGILLIVRISWQLARTTTQHLDVHCQALVDTNWVDLQYLVPVPWVLRALQQGDVGFKVDDISDLKAVALARLYQRAITLATGVVLYVNEAVRTVVLHLHG